MSDEIVRRPLRSRGTRWAASIARTLTRWRVRPNQISLLSMVFAGCAGFLFSRVPAVGLPCRIACLVGGAVCIQLRLLCNLFDGMVAVEGGMKTPSGEVYNDLPDRVADALILVGAGYGIAGGSGPLLGWFAALLAVFTAYVRLLGGTRGKGSRSARREA